ncbi:MAG: hypothetical protein CL960_03085 [Euryarchaeota archaeon]|jgi:hypothetical protein|nr:hypothetical protein [Euryarchaeota archaeon]MDP6364111.1 hypothetical protein [Candidatus Poseidoniia archaeon]MDP6658494.1 hypothetical protein [Candidatus Poseidoniia archaeon]MDP6846434.1 hypothetical protein [Candidatus Poseidoniia archaeon]MDP7007537.1 hypothetical protein [Candidatus Poseidoniia archaeon]|tara:strand:+ start:4090 stop:4404 length:315 start_codon:yes stop_codon:yes gene_type:complete
MECQLCALPPGDSAWRITDCPGCGLPLLLWLAHDSEPVRAERREMRAALREHGNMRYGRGNYLIDRFPAEFPDHFHWHCRPNLSPQLVEELALARGRPPPHDGS